MSSGGGHWIELMRIVPAFEEGELVFVSVNPEYGKAVAPHRFYSVPDATRWNKIAAVLVAFRVLAILLFERPDVVVTTGAAHGYFAVRFGKWIGARTIWMDSIANVEEMSMSGRMAGPHADLWLTQWPHLARARQGETANAPHGTHDGRSPEYSGAVL